MGMVRAFDVAGEAVDRWLDRQVMSDNVIRGCGAVLAVAALLMLLVALTGATAFAVVVLLYRMALGAWRFLTP